MRKAIELRELGELSTEETARALGLSVQAVKGRVFHGRKKLRKSLERYVCLNRSFAMSAVKGG
jgi:RNA polymerase sigma-70 factor (ECF subfamily)